MSSKELELAADLVPIGKFRSGTAKILEEMNAEGRTLVITQNGKAAAALASRLPPDPDDPPTQPAQTGATAAQPAQPTPPAAACPSPGPGELLVRVGLAGLCRTDLYVARGELSCTYPRVLGHECGGRVAARGQVDAVAGVRLPGGLGGHGSTVRRVCGETAHFRENALRTPRARPGSGAAEGPGRTKDLRLITSDG